MSDIDYEKLEEDLFKLHNQVRTNPQSFIPKLKSVLTCFKNKIYHIPGEEPIQTFEGSQAVKEAMPGLGGPTVSEIYGNDNIVAVHSVISEKDVFHTINKLRLLGAKDLLVLPIERILE